jgi:hypothetical protein
LDERSDVICMLWEMQALGAGRVVWISTPKYPINTVALIIGSKKAPAAPKSTAAASRDAFFDDVPFCLYACHVDWSGVLSDVACDGCADPGGASGT